MVRVAGPSNVNSRVIHAPRHMSALNYYATVPTTTRYATIQHLSLSFEARSEFSDKLNIPHRHGTGVMISFSDNLPPR